MPTRSPLKPFDHTDLAPAEDPARRQQIQRRRANALAVLGVLVLAVSIAVEAGSSGSRRGTTAASAGRVTRVPPPGEVARRRVAPENRAIDRVVAYTPF